MKYSKEKATEKSLEFLSLTKIYSSKKYIQRDCLKICKVKHYF